MGNGTDRTGRLVAGAIALTAWGGVVAQLMLALPTGAANGTPGWMVVWNLFSYFTILTNTLVALVTTHFAVNGRDGHWLVRPGTLAATVVYIAIVGLIYQTILAATNPVQGVGKVVDSIVHGVVPLTYPLWWLAFGRLNRSSARLQWRQTLPWMAYPTAYCLYSLVRGALLGRYPYPFIDVGTLGYVGAAVNIAGLVLLFLAGALLVIGLDRLLPQNRN